MAFSHCCDVRPSDNVPGTNNRVVEMPVTGVFQHLVIPQKFHQLWFEYFGTFQVGRVPRLFHNQEPRAEQLGDPFAVGKRDRPIVPPPDEERLFAKASNLGVKA